MSDRSRRSVLKMIGAGTVAFGGISGKSGARQTSTVLDIKKLDGDQSDTAISEAKSQSEFIRLKQRVLKREPVAINEAGTTVLEVSDQSGTPHQIVDFELERTDGAGTGDDRPDGDIAVILRDGEYLRASASLLEFDDRALVTATNYKFSSGQANKRINVGDSLTGTDNRKSIVSERTEVNMKLDVGSGSDPGSLNGVSTTTSAENTVTITEDDVDTTTDVTVGRNSLECWACTVIGDAVCAAGCAVGGAAICGSLWIVGSFISGTACTAIAGAICAILNGGMERYMCASCVSDLGIEWVCHHAGYCSEPKNVCDT